MAVALSACAMPMTAARPGTPACDGESMIETQLFFGLSKPTGGTVSPREWNTFINATVVPHFPQGFSVVDSDGYWYDSQSKRTISEKSKIIVRLNRFSNEEENAIADIVATYKKRFDQQAVLRVDKTVCAKF
jgi:hypothetical protein